MEAIHPTAIISDGAVLGEGTTVGPYSVIGANVRLGNGNRVGSHVVIEGHTTIGDENTFYQFASVGSDPQDLKFHGEPSTLTIGSNNKIREYVTIQPGTEGGGMKTEVGDGNLFMASSHVGHDCIIGSRNVFANSVALSGHVEIGNGAILGGMTGIHQFVRVGDLAFTGAGAMVTKDVPPFCLAQGDRAELIGLNGVGLKRNGFSREDLSRLKELYREAFFGPGVFSERIAGLREHYADFDHGERFLAFVAEAPRGVTLPRRDSLEKQEKQEN